MSQAPPPPQPPSEEKQEPSDDEDIFAFLDAGREERPEIRARPRSFLRELPVLIVIAFVIALVIKTFLLQAFYIPSASMEPTLREGDRVLVEKLSYRWGEPQPGDVVVFERDLAQVIAPPPEDEEDQPVWVDIQNAFRSLFGFPTGTAQDFIKRVVGVAGDTVEGRDDRVYVNGKPLEEDYLPEGTIVADFSPVTVPEGQIFVMGDNRNNSDDSRNFGPVPVDTVVGHAFILIWPPQDFGTL